MADRLSRDEWLRHGLKTLAQSGDSALKADKLARALGVSRGSFYWHFKDLADYHGALLEAWREQATGAVIAEIDAAPEATDRLEKLMRRAFTGDLSLERGMRAWATHNADAGQMAARVDEQRVAFLTKLLDEAGVAPEASKPRALFLYWAFLGQALAPQAGRGALTQPQIDAVAALLAE